MSDYKYGKKSKERLATVDRRLSYIFGKALDVGLIDISILHGARGQEEQDELCERGLSKCKWPESKHNVKTDEYKAMAVDAAPFVNGKPSYDHLHCCFLAGLILGIGKQFGYEIRWGGNWDMDGEPVTDQEFQDLLHFELVEAY